MQHLQEANTYAIWSEQDRASKLPVLTQEQRQQIHEYLQIVQEHGLTKSIQQQQQQQQANMTTRSQYVRNHNTANNASSPSNTASAQVMDDDNRTSATHVATINHPCPIITQQQQTQPSRHNNNGPT
jgi:hypothetical protein